MPRPHSVDAAPEALEARGGLGGQLASKLGCQAQQQVRAEHTPGKGQGSVKSPADS
jgi:hypothetical protein